MLDKFVVALILASSLLFPSYGAATEAPSPPVLQLPSTIHTTASDGREISVPAGTYRVEVRSGTTLQLVATPALNAQEIHALSFTHEESPTAPLSFTMREKDRDDAAHLLLLLSDGTGLDAAGRIGDVQTRGGELIAPTRRQYTGMVLDSKHKMLQRKHEVIDAQMKEAWQRADDAMNRATSGMIMGLTPAGTSMRLQRCDICKLLQTRRATET